MTLASGDITITLSQLTPCWLRENYLTGLEITDKQGKAYPDAWYETHLANAVRKIEMLCDLCILERVINRESHDYRINDFQQYGFLQVYKQPVRVVRKLRMLCPPGATIIEYPDEWIQITPTGQINLVPVRGSIGSLIIGAGGDFLPLIYGGVTYVPSLWEVDYTAGMDPENMPREVVEAIAKLACIDLLIIVSNLVRPIGVNSESLSIDGLSQSQSYQAPAFSAHIAQYTSDLYGPQGKQQELTMTSGLLKQLMDVYRPINLASL